MFFKGTAVGNLGKDPVIKDFNGTKMASFSIAINKKVKGEKKTSWVNVKAWGKTAEIIEQYASKGRLVLVHGEIFNEAFEDKASGKMRDWWVLTVDNAPGSFKLLDKRDESEDRVDFGGASIGTSEAKAPVYDESGFCDDDPNVPF